MRIKPVCHQGWQDRSVVKGLGCQAWNLSSILRTHIVEGEDLPPQVILSPSYMPHDMHMCVHTHEAVLKIN